MRQIAPKRAVEDGLFVFLNEAGDVVEMFAGASRFSEEAVDLLDDPPLFSEWCKRNESIECCR
ncbi:hypothetical protein [Pseudomonas avellanae]|uniref:hypothetical protein n=1 Tax=Pseudomonas avellanae TaxID=46257 RepID=UPI00201B4BD5|nr:hypothetical protein [Pseudomonas avellanae]UQW75749.1 hypothetical protein L2Y01_08045 [Pseudomonas avellanae]